MATTTSAGMITRPGVRQLQVDGMAVLTIVLLLVVGFVVLYPILLLALNSFRVGVFGQTTTWGVDNWVAAFSQPRIVNALKNTLSLALTRQAIAILIGVSLAWLLARTNLPGRSWLEFAFW